MDYAYALDVLAEDGSPIERTAVAPDWKAALEWVRFEGIRSGRLEPVTGIAGSTIEPLWDAAVGEPVVSAFRVTVGSPDGRAVSRDIPRAYLRAVVEDVSADLVKKGRLTVGQTFQWALSAFPAVSASPAVGALPDPAAAAVPAVSDGDFDVEEVPTHLPVSEAPLAAFLACSRFAGPEGAEREHVPVFVPSVVLEETIDLARRAGDVETGGVLVGELHRDAHPADGEAPELFIEATAQIPAEHTVSGSAKLTFSAETWAAVHAAIALRRRDEIMLGWWHYHPDFCRLRNCPPERRRVCEGASPFFSADDVHLHASCFPAGHHVALLISESSRDGSMVPSVFGWSQGMVVGRGFHILEGATDATNTTATD